MKRFCFIFLPLLLLCVSLRSPALAAGETAAERGLEKIKTARNWDCIVLPREESYLEDWKTLYTRQAWYAPSLFVETMPEIGSGIPPQPSVFEGTEVTVVAEENGMSCILYSTPDYRRYTGWIKSIRLLDEFPGEEITLGAAPDSCEPVPDVENAWSYGYLPGTEQPYTVLAEPVKDCVGFTLEYQLIAENTANKNLVWGPRSVWVSDGEKWSNAGVYDYPQNGVVRVQIWLPEMMDVSAVATVAHCDMPNLFDFRQLAQDFFTAGS